MTKTRPLFVKSLALLSAVVLISTSAMASVVYDNTDPLRSLGQSFSPGNGTEFGDEIILSGTDRVITDFRFEYYLSSSSGNETAQLRFYPNDVGNDPTALKPGTALYDSGPFSLSTGFQTVIAGGLEVAVPGRFTWAVSFNGIEAGEQAGLLVYDPPTIGSSFKDFWQKSGDDWGLFLLENGNVNANFAARVTAVPEPTTVGLAFMAGLTWLGYVGYKRRKA